MRTNDTLRGSEQLQPVDVARLLVPLDGSEDAARAIAVARLLASRLDAEVAFMGVVAPDVERSEIERAVDEAAAGGDALVTAANNVADRIVEVAGRTPGTVVCMASHGRGRTAALLGSVAAEVAARTTEPVIVVGPHVGDDAQIDRVVACVDGSVVSESALPAAAAWAAALDVDLSIVTVAEPVPQPVTPGASAPRHHGRPHAPEGYLEAIAAPWQDCGITVTTAAVYDPISVAGGLADHVEAGPGALVVVATHGRTGLARLAHGSVAATIVHQLRSPILLVPEPR